MSTKAVGLHDALRHQPTAPRPAAQAGAGPHPPARQTDHPTRTTPRGPAHGDTRLRVSHLRQRTNRGTDLVAATPRPRHHLATPRRRHHPRTATLPRLPTPRPTPEHRMRPLRRRPPDHRTTTQHPDRSVAPNTDQVAAQQRLANRPRTTLRQPSLTPHLPTTLKIDLSANGCTCTTQPRFSARRGYWGVGWWCAGAGRSGGGPR